jgi:hypothetical protein
VPGDEILMSDGNNTLVRNGNLIVYVRRGPLTIQALDRLESTARLMRSSTKDPIGLMTIVEESAPVSSQEMRKQQRALIANMLAGERTFVVLTLGFSGVRSQLMATVARTLYRQTAHLHVARDPDEGAAWLSPKIGWRPDDALSQLAEARRLAASPGT